MEHPLGKWTAPRVYFVLQSIARVSIPVKGENGMLIDVAGGKLTGC
jgi:hypothetical protein